LAKHEDDAAQTSERAFRKRLNALCAKGAVTAGTHRTLLKAGAESSWNLSLLAPFQTSSAVATQSIARSQSEFPGRKSARKRSGGLFADDRLRQLSRKVMGLAPAEADSADE
jgi:hypothetical protein